MARTYRHPFLMDNPGKLVHKKTNKDTAQYVLYTITFVLNHKKGVVSPCHERMWFFPSPPFSSTLYYPGGEFYWWRKTEDSEKTIGAHGTDLPPPFFLTFCLQIYFQ
jgi:hypothetical protein